MAYWCFFTRGREMEIDSETIGGIVIIALAALGGWMFRMERLVATMVEQNKTAHNRHKEYDDYIKDLYTLSNAHAVDIELIKSHLKSMHE